jgi:large subunit ribosomal protein L24
VKLRRGDTVRAITGKDKGKEGVVERVFPKEGKVIVTGVNTAARHQRARRANEQGGIIDRDMPVHVSNVMLVHKGKSVRVGYTVNKNGEKVRVARPSGEVIS